MSARNAATPEGAAGDPAPLGHSLDIRTAAPPRTRGALVREAAAVLPNLAVLVTRLLRDPRVPRRRKIVAAVAATYLAAPFDLVPDVVPVLGQIDDAVVAAFAIHHLLGAVDPEVRSGYWRGSEDALDVVEALVAWGAELVPEPLRRMVGG